MVVSAIATRRLRKELTALQKDPAPDIIAEPKEDDILTWFFCFRGPPDTPYSAGMYIGKLKFPPEYPTKPPAILMLTPSGRFVVNQRICMSMSDFHPESWQPSWSVSTILKGVVSFMASEELTTGGMNASSQQREKLAQLSAAYNQKHHGSLFGGDITAAFAVAEQARKEMDEQQAAELGRQEQQEAQRPQRASRTKQQVNGTSSAAAASPSTQQDNRESNELTPEEAEKRRQKNAKKRAKQKAKKQAAAAVPDSEDDDKGETV